MRNKLSFRKRLYCAAVVCLAWLAASSNQLYATDITYGSTAGNVMTSGAPEVVITYDLGILGTNAFQQAQTVKKNQTVEEIQNLAAGSTVVFSDRGVDIPGYVIIGWHTQSLNIPVTYNTIETLLKTIPGYYAIGDSLTVTEDMTLHAVYGLDLNENKVADYQENETRPILTWERNLNPEPDQDGEDISLRSMPQWDTKYDAAVYDDSVYYVGCAYNTDHSKGLYETLIRLVHKDYTFNNAITSPDTVMNLVFKYEGVLEDDCLIGGKDQKPLKSIKITADMVTSGITLDQLIDIYPLMFSSIKKDGKGILKMYFTFRDGKQHPDMSHFSPAILWTKPFKDMETGAFTDTLTIKFNIYNKPEFKSSIISQSVDSVGYIKLNHLSGTPLKYMMRCINGFRWRPAASPLTNAERGEIGNNVSICLREMDPTIGYQNFQIQYFLSDRFDKTVHSAEWSYVQTLTRGIVSDSIFWADFYYDTNYNLFIKPTYDALIASGSSPYDAASLVVGIFAGSLATPPITPVPAYIAHINALVAAKADAYWPIYGQEKAKEIYVPDPCRGMFCLAFEDKVYPIIQREVYIPQVNGVTIDPGYGTHYVESQGDFKFSAKYTTEQPLKVTTNRIVDGKAEELSGRLNANGEYEYVIQKVTQNIVLTFGPGSVDNASVINGTAVWSHNNTINIRVAEDDVASIYSIAGKMVKRIELSEGDTPVAVERGVYLVTLKDGSVHKVIVK